MCFNISDSSNFRITDILLIVVHAFTTCILISFSVYETLLTRYVNLSTSFREPRFSVEMSPLWLKYMSSVFVCIHVEAYVPCCPLQTMQLGFGLSGCTCNKCYVINVVNVRNSSCSRVGCRLLLTLHTHTHTQIYIYIYIYISRTKVIRLYILFFITVLN